VRSVSALKDKEKASTLGDSSLPHRSRHGPFTHAHRAVHLPGARVACRFMYAPRCAHLQRVQRPLGGGDKDTEPGD